MRVIGGVFEINTKWIFNKTQCTIKWRNYEFALGSK